MKAAGLARRAAHVCGIATTVWMALSAPSARSATSLEREAEARQVLAAAPLIDGHNDVPIRLRERTGGELEDFPFARLPDEQRAIWHTDIDWLRAGGVGGQFWSVYVPADRAPAEAVREVLEQIDLVKRLVARHPDALELATSAGEIERAQAQGRIASMIGAEGGHVIGNSLGVLRQLYALGVRYLTLTHSRTTQWADSATDAPCHDGLAPFGNSVVIEMNRLGMLVDLSHVSAATMHDALDISVAPVIFSHSSAYALNPHPRNVPDDVLVRLRSNGGLVMVSLIARATSPAVNQWAAAEEGERARLAALHPDAPSAVANELAAWQSAHPRPAATIAEVADHIDHVRAVAGIEAIGIGSDFDGDRYHIAGLENASRFPALFAELLHRGYARRDLELIARGNILRVLRQAEAVAARLRAQPPRHQVPAVTVARRCLSIQ